MQVSLMLGMDTLLLKPLNSLGTLPVIWGKIYFRIIKREYSMLNTFTKITLLCTSHYKYVIVTVYLAVSMAEGLALSTFHL